MEKIELKNAESPDSGLIKALEIVFPNERIRSYNIYQILEVTVSEISLQDINNVITLLELYKKDMLMYRTGLKICLKIFDKKEEEYA